MTYKENIYSLNLKSNKLVITNGVDNAGVDCVVIAYDGVVKKVFYTPEMYMDLHGFIKLITNLTGVNLAISVDKMIEKEIEQRSQHYDDCEDFENTKKKLREEELIKPKYKNYKYRLYKSFNDTFEVPPAKAFKLYKNSNYHAFVGSVDEKIKKDLFLNKRGISWNNVYEYHANYPFKVAVQEAYADNLRHLIPIFHSIVTIFKSRKRTAIINNDIDHPMSDFRLFCRNALGSHIWKVVCKNTFYRNKLISRHETFHEYVLNKLFGVDRVNMNSIENAIKATVLLPSCVLAENKSTQRTLIAQYIMKHFDKVQRYININDIIAAFYFSAYGLNFVNESRKDYLHSLIPDIIKNTTEFTSKYKLFDFFRVLTDTSNEVGYNIINMSPRRVIEEHRRLTGEKMAKYILSQSDANAQFMWINHYKGDISFIEPNTKSEVKLLRTKAEVVEEGLKMHHCVGGAYSRLCSTNDYMVWTLKASRNITIGYNLKITNNAISYAFNQAYYAHNEAIEPYSPDAAALEFVKEEISKRVNPKTIDLKGFSEELSKISSQTCTV